MATANASLAHPHSAERLIKSEIVQDDPRLELVDRIVSTPAFQKAIKLQALLRFIVEQSLRDDSEEITEHRIGIEVFDKGPDYSPLLDSSVRVQARQLRLKLHEYFDAVGRGETIILEIPKGSYRPTFRSVVQEEEATSPEIAIVETAESADLQPPNSGTGQAIGRVSWLPWAVASISVVVALLLVIHSVWETEGSAPWPLTVVMGRGEASHLILADSAYQIAATANSKSIGLSEYLRTKPRNDAAINPADPADVRLAHALAGGTFTSFADVVLVNSLSTVAGKYKLDLDVKSAKDLAPRDLEQGNFILVGSPSSNPWVSLYSSKLNFREADDLSNPGMKMFLNTHPQGTEPKAFEGSSSDNAVRVDYADLAVVPGLGEHGTVMLVQGLRHEATEAAARLLADPMGSKMLVDAIRSAGEKSQPAYFETLLSVRAVAGIPQVTGVAAVRVFHK